MTHKTDSRDATDVSNTYMQDLEYHELKRIADYVRRASRRHDTLAAKLEALVRNMENAVMQEHDNWPVCRAVVEVHRRTNPDGIAAHVPQATACVARGRPRHPHRAGEA